MNTSFKSAGRITGMFLSMVLLGGLCFAEPAVTLSVTTGPPTTNLTVSGSGFPASTAVDIYFDTTELALAVTNSTGSFSGVDILVPPSALPGTNWFTGVAPVTGDGAQAPFNVQANWAQFHFAGSHSGRNPYENVLSRKTARELGLSWSYYSGGPSIYTSPAVADGVVYFGSGDGNIHALNAGTGAQLWQFATEDSLYSSPAVANGVVYVGSANHNLYALNASTGAKLWQFTTGGAVQSCPAVANGGVYFGSWDGSVYALDAFSGSKLWQFSTGNVIQSSPAVANGMVFVGSYDSNLYAFSDTINPAQAPGRPDPLALRPTLGLGN
jgi:hypothetical protein